jgi:hypothetical protein
MFFFNVKQGSAYRPYSVLMFFLFFVVKAGVVATKPLSKTEESESCKGRTLP